MRIPLLLLGSGWEHRKKGDVCSTLQIGGISFYCFAIGCFVSFPNNSDHMATTLFCQPWVGCFLSLFKKVLGIFFRRCKIFRPRPKPPIQFSCCKGVKEFENCQYWCQSMAPFTRSGYLLGWLSDFLVFGAFLFLSTLYPHFEENESEIGQRNPCLLSTQWLICVRVGAWFFFPNSGTWDISRFRPGIFLGGGRKLN